MLVAMAVFARQRGIDWGRLMDFVAPLTPVGLALGRLGNFIGQELWGRPAGSRGRWSFRMTRSVWRATPRSSISLLWRGACCFSSCSGTAEAAADLGSIRRLPDGLRCAAILRRIFPRADAHIGFDALGWMTRGQLLCLPMLVAGIGLLYWAYRPAKR